MLKKDQKNPYLLFIFELIVSINDVVEGYGVKEAS